MPELPEVEVTRRGIAPALEGVRIAGVVVRNPRLRWPIPPDLDERLRGAPVRSVRRRAKYLLIGFDEGSLIVHLGMSGSLRLVSPGTPPGPWDHFDLLLARQILRLRDPRRFGAVLWQSGAAEGHVLLRGLGIEPLEPGFSGAHLHAAARNRRVAIKQLLMDASVVVGIGNIYASESLFRSSIHPLRSAARVSAARYERLAGAVQDTLRDALAAGGSTLRDFVGGDGQPGYFQQQYFVYGRTGAPCRACGLPVRRILQGQRSTFYCAGCQR
jgi:formamidopyrimidine-DNA glycosylase